jgi:ATP-dependent Clp protease ATP-binding subunit ClpA
MFERFTPDARQTVVQAREEAHQLHNGFIGCEHLLLALSGGQGTPAAGALAAFGLDTAALRERVAGLAGPGDQALDADALASLGIDLDTVRRATEASFGRGALDGGSNQRGRSGNWSGRIPFTPRAKKTLELALRAAVKCNDKEITTGHLLLGLIGQEDNAALRILGEAGVEADALRQELAKRMAAAA